MKIGNIELLALRIGGDYGIIRDQNLIFSPEFKIDIIINNSILYVTVSKNENYIPNFFSNKVSNICGIVGKNGVGKTTILRYIKELFIKDDSGLKERYDDIIIYKEDDKLILYCNENYKRNERFTVPEGFISEINYFIGFPKLYNKITNLNVIYYSNNMDLGQRETESPNYYNISTSYLLENLGRINSRLRNKRIQNQNANGRYRYTEMQRQINLINNLDNKKLDIPFKKIDHVQIIVDEIYPDDYKKLNKKIEYLIHKTFDGTRQKERFNQKIDDTRDWIHHGLNEFESAYQKNKDTNKNNSVSDFLISIFENIHYVIFEKLVLDDILILSILDEGKLYNSFLNLFFNSFKVDKFNTDKGYVFLLKEIKELFLNYYNIHTQLPSEQINHALVRKLRAHSKNIESIEKFIKFIVQIHNNYGSESLMISIKTDDKKVDEILKEYYSSDFEFNFIKFSWPKLSAGEESLIAFFSRLYSISQASKAENLLLLIDEGELYFHPEWQRKYLYFLIEFYKSNFIDYKNIQMILTTHSPFIISDLPSEYVIFMDRDEKTKLPKIISSKENNIQTFGGNIHSLYSNAFFIGNRTIGEFANKKIKEEIVDAMKKKNSEKSKNKILKLIEKVGEPLLKQILQDQLLKS
jgi:predicted ATP-binding protein involved in virulence